MLARLIAMDKYILWFLGLTVSGCFSFGILYNKFDTVIENQVKFEARQEKFEEFAWKLLEENRGWKTHDATQDQMLVDHNRRIDTLERRR